MKDKMLILKRVLIAVISVAVLALYVWFGTVKLDGVGQVKIWFLSLFYCAIGLLIGKICNSLLHELGHIIPLRKSKVVIIEFCFLCFYFVRVDGKIKLRFNFKPNYDGFVTFVCKDPTDSKKYLRNSVIGALVASLAMFLICNLLICLTISLNAFVICLLGGATVASMYSIFLNFLIGMPTSDGVIILGKNDKINDAVEKLEISSRLYNGESLLDMPENLFADGENFKNGYYSYLRLMQKGDLDGAVEVLAKTVFDNQKSCDNRLIALDLELFFVAVIQGNTQVIDELKEGVLAFCDKNVDLTTLRVAIMYRKYSGESQWTDALEKTFNTQGEKAFTGVYKTEKAILDNFS